MRGPGEAKNSGIKDENHKIAVETPINICYYISNGKT
jgi:hypothetical protein